MITTPTPAQIYAQKIADFESALAQTMPSVSKSFYRTWAKSDSLSEAGIYEYAKWLYKQIFPQTQDEEALMYLGGRFGITRTAATSAILAATATGENDTIIPAGTLWQFNGIVYSQSDDVIIATGTATIEIESLTLGSDGNIDNGGSVSLVSPLAGVDDDATITSTTTEGEDAEEIEDYRSRVISRMSQQPQGGATPDYIQWALEVAGIVKAFAFNDGPNNVIVYPLQSLTTDRIPAAPKLAEVETYLNDTGRKPLCANVSAEAMTEREITLTVSSINPDNVATKAAIELAINDYLLTCFPLQYPDESNPTNIISLSTLYAEARGAGANSISMTMTIDGVPGDIEAYTLQDSEIVKLADIVWP
jgi:uncharacterized phage protein gp47/JayE